MNVKFKHRFNAPLGSVEIELNIYKLMVFSEVFTQVIEIIVFFKDYI
tara:strand:- start:245 stop:385 length:141 start_codon:yes stop_codon:yes gene_type:complete